MTTPDERALLRDAVGSLLRARVPETRLRELIETEDGVDPLLWSELGSQGFLGLAVPERFGGAGYGLSEFGVILEQAGRVLLCAPLVSSVLMAQQALLIAGDVAAQARYLPGLASGELRGTVAWLEPGGRRTEDAITTRADVSGGGWLLTGTKVCVLDGQCADLLLVLARTPDGVSLFAVDSDASGVAVTAVPTLDMTRKQATVDLESSPGHLVAESGSGWSTLERLLDVVACGLAAEQVGAAQRAMETAVEYAKVRQQFGRAIGSFQAVKHLCAQMLVRVESARAIAQYALESVDATTPDLPVVAAAAAAHCSEAFVGVAADVIQVHGGIGFTWEHPAHLFLKRAKATQLLFGDAVHWRDLLAIRTGIATGSLV